MTEPRMPLSRQDLVDLLTDQIMDGEIPAGGKLPSERHLAETYALSRPIVREALRSLQERGLIRIAAGRGAFVRTAESTDLARPMDSLARQRGATPRHLVEARAMLERQAAALAAQRAGKAEIAALERALEAFEGARNVLDRARGDLAFHALIAKASRNPVIETMFGSIAPLVFELQLRSLDDPVVVAQGGPLHRVVLRAIAARDAEGAAGAMHTHVTLAVDLFGEDLDTTLDTIARRKVARLLGPDTRLEDVIADVVGP
jgi:GntR family transcriptional repressor for pyruvate dehydrogenase complex